MTSKFLKLTVAVVILVSSIFCLSGCGKKTEEASNNEVSKEVYEKPIRAYLDGIKAKNLEQVLQAYPEFMHMEKLITQENIEDLNKTYAETEYTLGEATNVDDKGIEKLESQFKLLYADAGEIKIEKAYIITVKITKVSPEVPQEGQENAGAEQTADATQDEKNNTRSQDFYSYCYNGNWYMLY